MDIDKIDAEIGERAHQLMWRRRVSQRDLAKALGVDPAAASRRLRGHTAWKMSEVIIISRLLDVDLSELIPDEALTRKNAGAEFRCTPASGQPTALRIVHSDEIADSRRMPIRHAL